MTFDGATNCRPIRSRPAEEHMEGLFLINELSLLIGDGPFVLHDTSIMMLFFNVNNSQFMLKTTILVERLQLMTL